MIHETARKTSEGSNELEAVSATTVADEAKSGGRSAGDPSPDGMGLMGPSRLCSETPWLLAEIELGLRYPALPGETLAGCWQRFNGR